jgi:hypothetical protein
MNRRTDWRLCCGEAGFDPLKVGSADEPGGGLEYYDRPDGFDPLKVGSADEQAL